MIAPAIAHALALIVTASTPEEGQDLFVRECLGCHRGDSPSQVDLAAPGPRGRRALTAAAAVRDGLMPPWLPGPMGAPLAHERRLNEHERATLVAWLERGAIVEGKLPPAPSVGVPAATTCLVNSPSWEVGAAPGMAMRAFAVELGNSQSLRVQGLALRCDSPGLVHSISLLADTRGYAQRLDAADPSPGYDAAGDIGLDASGSAGAVARLQGEWLLPRGCALEIPAQSTLVLEVHADPRGRTESTACRIDFFGADPGATTVKAYSFSRVLGARIGDASRAMTVLVRAGSNALGIHVIATAPDGSRTTLLEIPRWNERFSEPWNFDPPVPLAAGTQLSVEWTTNEEAPVIPATSHAAAMVEPTVVVLTAPAPTEAAQAIVTFGSR